MQQGYGLGWWVLQAKIMSLLSASQTCKNASFFLTDTIGNFCVLFGFGNTANLKENKYTIKKKKKKMSENAREEYISKD